MGLDLTRVAEQTPPSAGRIWEMIERHLTYLGHLVHDPMGLATINIGKIQLKTSMVLLKDVMLSAVETTLPGIQAKNRDFGVHVPDETIWLDADADRLVQVLGNECPKSAARPQPVQRRRRCRTSCNGQPAAIPLGTQRIAYGRLLPYPIARSRAKPVV